MTDYDRIHLVDSILVPHRAFQSAIKRINQCLKVVDGSAEPICIPLVGESGTGKSRALAHICKGHEAVRGSEGIIIHTLRVTTPSRPTVKGLCSAILRALGDPLPDKGTENNMVHRVINLIKSTGIRLLVLEEFQQFYDNQSHRVMHHVCDTLKIILDESKIVFVVSGLETSRIVLEQNEQLARRFLAPIKLPRFDWKSEDDRDEFTAILEAFHQQLSSKFDLPTLDSDEMAFRFYCASGGLIGYVSKLLRLASWNVIDEGRSTITLEDLDQALKHGVLSENSWNGKTPFERGFKAHPTEPLLTMAGNIGVPVIGQSPRRRGRIAVQQVSAANVLTT